LAKQLSILQKDKGEISAT